MMAAAAGLACGLAGCLAPDEGLYRRFQDENPAVRIDAIIQAGQTKDAPAVPYLVDRLSDSDREVRVFAIVALEKITGQTLGYRHYDPPELRGQAIRRWRDWLAASQTAAPAARATQPSGGKAVSSDAMEGK